MEQYKMASLIFDGFLSSQNYLWSLNILKNHGSSILQCKMNKNIDKNNAHSTIPLWHLFKKENFQFCFCLCIGQTSAVILQLLQTWFSVMLTENRTKFVQLFCWNSCLSCQLVALLVPCSLLLISVFLSLVLYQGMYPTNLKIPYYPVWTVPDTVKSHSTTGNTRTALQQFFFSTVKCFLFQDADFIDSGKQHPGNFHSKKLVVPLVLPLA